ncbi:MAG: helix-turn-helix transcriptional regulator, partial [Acidimicrobiales bacterium]
VEPHRLVLLGRRWYLVAFDLARFDWRSFRVDRLADPSNTGVPSMPRSLPEDDAAEFVRRGIENVPAQVVVEAVVHAEASEVRARIGPWAVVEALEEGRCVVRISTDSPDWAVLGLGAAGGEFEIVQPREFAEHLRRWSDRLSRAAAGSER